MRSKRNDKSRRPKNILILLWSSTISSGREFLGGFTKQARARRNWQLHLRISKRIPESNILQTIRLGGYDGIVTDEDTFNSLPKGTIPEATSVVVFGTYAPNAPKNVAFVQNDNAAIARFGANYLLRLGRFRSFGFFLLCLCVSPSQGLRLRKRMKMKEQREESRACSSHPESRQRKAICQTKQGVKWLCGKLRCSYWLDS